VTHAQPLRRGWTTGACATAAAKAAYAALLEGGFPDPVTIALPGGQHPAFALAETRRGDGYAEAGVVKDAGDDPDVTHGALVRARVRLAPPGTGIAFRAGPGVGTVTRPGLPLPPGEPAINPVPRRMIAAALAAVTGHAADAVVEISIPGGETLAARTLNRRLGIVGGLSILGTTGIVVPYSCAAWIDTIHRGIDVARAAGLAHIAGATGSGSETAIRALYGLPDAALIEMGDYVGAMLKYVRRRPVPRVTIAGGVAKMTKLAQGQLDLHSRRGEADLAALAALAGEPRIAAANTVAEAFALAGPGLGDVVSEAAWRTAAEVLAGTGVVCDVAIFDRDGRLVGRHEGRNRRT
jgi:cobalt-precorrin-5B (C1)-methyltransferase